MNMNQFTQKSLEAVQAAQTLATEHGNQQIEQVHLLCALVEQEGGFVPQLLTQPPCAMRWRSCPRCPALAGEPTRCISLPVWTRP